MIYLSGAVGPWHHPDFGFMFTPQMGNILPANVLWAADNGRFAAPEKYTHRGYLEWLRSRPPCNCLFATAPDCLGNHVETVQLSTPLLPWLRAVGYSPAFVAQDGWDEATVPWALFDWLFIGGSTEFKLGLGLTAARQAQRRGKNVHMGRVNSYKRFCIAADAGCVSVDGTFLKFGPKKNWPRLCSWFTNYERLVDAREQHYESVDHDYSVSFLQAAE